MKITVNDPMIVLRQAKAAAVNRNFNTIAMESLHVDQAHAQKRILAATGDPRLKAEADLRGISVEELSALILSKPDNAAARELHRQTIMKRIDDAQTPEELNQLGAIL